MPSRARGSGASHDSKEPQSWWDNFCRPYHPHVTADCCTIGNATKLTFIKVQMVLTGEMHMS